MIRFILSANSGLLGPYASMIKKPVYFYPEREHSQLEQKNMARDSVVQWVEESGPGIIYVVTHSVHYVQAVRLALLKRRITPEQVSAVYLYCEEGSEIIQETEIVFDQSGRTANWPGFFMEESYETNREIVVTRRSLPIG